jgi:hypothetical protein
MLDDHSVIRALYQAGSARNRPSTGPSTRPFGKLGGHLGRDLRMISRCVRLANLYLACLLAEV